MRRHLLIPSVFAVSALLAGCSDDLPSKAEFVSQMEKESKADFTDALAGAGVDGSTADKMFADLVGCVYDKIAEDEDELRAVFDNSSSSEFNKVVEGKAKPCLDDFQTAVTEAISKSVSG